LKLFTSLNPHFKGTDDLCVVIEMVKILAYTHVWIALGAASAALATLHSIHPTLPWNEFPWYCLGAIVAATGLVYTFQRIIKLRRNPNSMPMSRRAFLDRWKWSLLSFWSVVVIGLIVAEPTECCGCLHWTPQQLVILLIIGVLAVGYASNPFGRGPGWRDQPRLKWPVIAVVWGLVTGWFPAQWVDPTHFIDEWTQFALQFGFVAGITLPFDCRDLSIDSPKLKTTPQLIGVQNTMRLAIFLVAASAVGFFIADVNLARFMVCGIAIIGMVFSQIRQEEWVYSLWIDGTLILQGLLSFLFSNWIF